MRVLFWGTPDFAVPTLRALSEEGHDVVGVITQPDRPAGRGRHERASPVKQAAIEDGLLVLTPERPRGDVFVDRIRTLSPDVSVVVAYGRILTREVLDVPRLGSFNLHSSLLPALRGAAPINWAIVRGHSQSGVTIMRMVEAMDAGPILIQEVEPIGPTVTAGELTLRLSELGATAFVEALALLSLGEVDEIEQDHSAATFAPKIDRSTARVDWSEGAQVVVDLIRGMDPVPGAWTTLVDQPVKLFYPEVDSSASASPPGTVIEADARTGIVVATGVGAVRIGEVQPSGKRRMAGTQWVGGRGIHVGERFE